MRKKNADILLLQRCMLRAVHDPANQVGHTLGDNDLIVLSVLSFVPQDFLAATLQSTRYFAPPRSMNDIALAALADRLEQSLGMSGGNVKVVDGVDEQDGALSFLFKKPRGIQDLPTPSLRGLTYNDSSRRPPRVAQPFQDPACQGRQGASVGRTILGSTRFLTLQVGDHAKRRDERYAQDSVSVSSSSVADTQSERI